MSLSIQFDGADDGPDGPFALATNNGWALFAAWADTLDPAVAHVRELAGDGLTTDTAALTEELAAAVKAHPPPPAVAHTAASLLEMIGPGDPDESAAVTDDDGTE